MPTLLKINIITNPYAVYAPASAWHGLAAHLFELAGLTGEFYRNAIRSISMSWPYFVENEDSPLLAAVWRFGVIDDAVAKKMLKFKAHGLNLTLGPVPLKLMSGFYADKGDGATWLNLLDTAESRASQHAALTLELLTPAITRRGSEAHLTLEPLLIFNPIQEKIVEHAPSKIVRMIEKSDFRKVRISRIRIDSVEFQLKKAIPEFGMLGIVEYSYEGDKDALIALHLAGLVAPFTGIGAKTSMGLGSVTVLS